MSSEYPQFEFLDVCGVGTADYAECAGTTTCPLDEPPEWRWEKDGPAADWFATGDYRCNGGPGRAPPSDQQIAARSAEAFALVPLPDAPGLVISPAGGAVVQLPLIISAAPQGVVTADITLRPAGFPPVPMTVTATPRFRFDLGNATGDGTGDGTGVDRADPGRAYDGTDPVDHPEHYVTVTYHQAGSARIAVTVTWTATAVRHDTGATLTLSGSKITSTSRTVAIREARSVLTG